MKRFKKDGKTLYFAISADADVHWVPDNHWKEYLEHRLNVPAFCCCYDSVHEAYVAAISAADNMGGHFLDRDHRDSNSDSISNGT